MESSAGVVNLMMADMAAFSGYDHWFCVFGRITGLYALQRIWSQRVSGFLCFRFDPSASGLRGCLRILRNSKIPTNSIKV